MSSNWKITGMNEVIAALSDLPSKLQVKVVKNFLLKAGRDFIVKPLKSELPYSTNQKRHIAAIQNPKNKLAVQAGVTSKGYKLRWLDLGTAKRTTEAGWNRGKIQGRNAIQPIIERQIEPVVKFVQTEMGNEINKILSRKLKKLRKA